MKCVAPIVVEATTGHNRRFGRSGFMIDRWVSSVGPSRVLRVVWVVRLTIEINRLVSVLAE
jgi:hypothetical protein